ERRGPVVGGRVHGRRRQVPLETHVREGGELLWRHRARLGAPRAAVVDAVANEDLDPRVTRLVADDLPARAGVPHGRFALLGRGVPPDAHRGVATTAAPTATTGVPVAVIDVNVGWRVLISRVRSRREGHQANKPDE